MSTEIIYIERCKTASVPELVWMCSSFVMYSAVLLYIGFQLSRTGYHGSRVSGDRVKFPESLVHMLYTWTLYMTFSVLASFMAYTWAGGWTSSTTVVLSLYFVLEALHTVWMVVFFRYAVYGGAGMLKLIMFIVQIYMLYLYYSIHGLLSAIYFPCTLLGLYELVVTGVVVGRYCRGIRSLVTSNVKQYQKLNIEERGQNVEDQIQEVQNGEEEEPAQV